VILLHLHLHLASMNPAQSGRSQQQQEPLVKLHALHAQVVRLAHNKLQVQQLIAALRGISVGQAQLAHNQHEWLVLMTL